MIVANKKYGVIPGKDSAKGINKAINHALSIGEKTVKIPKGNYFLEEPILIKNGDSFSCLNLIGDNSCMDWTLGTQLHMQYNESFGIGVQLGKGVTINGFSIRGRFNPDIKDFYRKKVEDFTDPNIKEDGYNPYAAIAIDPINTHPQTVYAGSTKTTIKNCRLFNTTVGIANSPNSVTRNAEMTTITDCQFGYNRVAVSGSHDQERNCVIRDSFAWEYVHTFFSSHRYGAGIGGNWNISNINIAGAVNTFIEWIGTGRFQTNVDRINTESLGKFGMMEGFSTVSNCEFGFIDPKDFYSDCHIHAQHGVEFINNKIRHYGHFIPVNIKGNAIFKGCDFERSPNYGIEPYYSGNLQKPVLDRSYVNLSVYNQEDKKYTDLGSNVVSKGVFNIDKILTKGSQILYDDTVYGWKSLGIATGDNEISYSEKEGTFNLIEIHGI